MQLADIDQAGYLLLIHYSEQGASKFDLKAEWNGTTNHQEMIQTSIEELKRHLRRVRTVLLLVSVIVMQGSKRAVQAKLIAALKTHIMY